ncbi:MAG TPA: chromosome segregation protein SMC [Egibacteraceae bacterium]|nr:chromosome segregation protein SMC [Egibacteraceae bacterium]
MFLKSLTLRGFKSFADKTELTFEPGITVVVGPNGSGKSNIVDALAWVLGTHSPKTLRGQAMADVVFAGSPRRPALGRAAVEITIDNSPGLLPIEFSEVTISRSMFASGENTYAINGVDCRLLDVQELLSDTGLGREHHTIVGQGRLDDLLNAKPEERRALIEDAAGILKHRKRKERALRKLGQVEGHLERLGDVLAELRRNLRPLERQAEAAAQHAQLRAGLRDVRVVRAVRKLAALADRYEAESARQEAARRRVSGLESSLAQLRDRETGLEALLDELAPATEEAAEVHFRLANLAERFRGLAARIRERRVGLSEAVEEPIAGRDPERLGAEAASARAELDSLADERDATRTALAAAETARVAAERARRAHEQAAAAEARRRAEARERTLRWEGEVSALRSALAQAASEEGRLASQLSGLRSRKSGLDADLTAVTTEIQRLDAEQVALAEQLAGAEAAVERRQRGADAAALRERELERRRASLEARADALRAASQEATGGLSALRAAAESGEIEGVVGPVAEHVEVAGELAAAAAAALGPLGDALVVSGASVAEAALELVRSRGWGRVLLLAADEDGAVHAQVPADLREAGARPVADGLRAGAEIHGALRRALVDVYAVADLPAAAVLARRHPELVFVSHAGDVAGRRGWAGGSAAPAGAVLSRAAADQADAQLELVADELLRAHRQVADADRELSAARRELDAATAAMQESDGLITAAAERLKRLRKELSVCDDELTLVSGQAAALAREIAEQRDRLAALEARGAQAAPPGPPEQGPDPEAERLDDELAHARDREVQARLAVSAAEQRSAELVRRVEALEEEAREAERDLAETHERRRWRLDAIERCGQLAVAADLALRRTEASLQAASAQRQELDAARGQHQRELGAVRAEARRTEADLATLVERHHREELTRQQLGNAVDAVRERLRDELSTDPDEALARARAGAQEVLAGGAARDAELADREERLARKLALLGTVNPLAAEELAALEERQRFLSEQLEDLRASRRDLLALVEAVDERVREVFAQAFADVAVQFEQLFARLFPGGEGRLALTDPDDLLASGVDIEARPPGKRVKRLSLLSGGERSLAALAMVFAIFAARPSPFYVLDEVEAALDDVNLQRFLDVVRGFRASSQLILVTHQKRTMEVADCLYGVAMQADGVSRVLSQRISEPPRTRGVAPAAR